MTVCHAIRYKASRFLGSLLYPEENNICCSMDSIGIDFKLGLPNRSTLMPHIDIAAPNEKSSGSGSWKLNELLSSENESSMNFPYACQVCKIICWLVLGL